MEKKKELSVFKCICWCVLLLLISFIVGVIVSGIWGLVIGWLSNKIGLVGKILSNKVVFFIFMSATLGDIGRRTSRVLMMLFAKPMDKSPNVGKGFLGAGIILIIYGIITCIACIYTKLGYVDLSCLTMGVWHVLLGGIAEESGDDVAEIQTKKNNSSSIEKKSNVSVEKSNTIFHETNEMSEEQIKGYAQYICDNCKGFEIEKESAEQFVRQVLIEFEKHGKTSALLEFEKFRKELEQKDTLFGPVKTSFFVGLMNANGIITQEEVDQLNDYYNEELMNSKKMQSAPKVKDVLEMTDEELKQYVDDYAAQGKWEAENVQMMLNEGDTYLQIAYNLQTF